MTECKPLLIALLGILSLTQASPAQALAPSLPTAEKLRRLLSFPDKTLRQTMDLSIGLEKSSRQEAEFFRFSPSSKVTQIIAMRRTLTGSTADAPRYAALGWQYRQVGLSKKSQMAFHRSEALYAKVLQRNPNDGMALSGYGRTLQALDQPAAAEAYLRKAARLAPHSADVWMACGSVLAAQASPQTEAASPLMHQATADFNRAVLLEPRNPAVWAARGDFRDRILPQFQGKLMTNDGHGDYEQAAALAPGDPFAQAMVPIIEGGVFEMTHHLYTSPEAAKRQPLDADRRAKKALQRLTAIAQAHHGRLSASAYKARAWVQFQYFYDPKGAQRSLQLALQQNPYQRDAADYQIHIAAVTGDYAQLAFFCRQELALHSEVRLHVLLAYADYFIAQQKPGYWREGPPQMELAHAAAPRDYACALGLAAFLLESGQTARADLLLNALEPQAKTRPKDQQTEYDLTCGIGAALAGKSERASAFFQLALKNDPKNRAGKSALALLPTGNHRRTVTR